MSDWQRVRLGDVAECSWGDTTITKKSYVNEGIQAFSAAGPDGFVDEWQHERPAVVLAAIGSCGATWFARGKWTAIKNTIWYRSKSTFALDEFLFLATSDPDFFPKRGQVQKFISLGDVRDRAFLLPPLPVQRRIVDLMTHLDNHIALLGMERSAVRGVLPLLREQLALNGSLVSLETLAGANGIQIGPFGSQLHSHEYVSEGIPVVMPRDLIAGRISEEKLNRISNETAERLAKHRLRPGDIIFPRRGDLSKRALVIEHQADWICGTGCLRFRPAAGVDGRAVFESLSGDAVTDWLVENAVGTTMLNLNTQILSNLPVSQPSVAASPLVEACAQMDQHLASLGDEIEIATCLRAQLLSELLAGSRSIPTDYEQLMGKAG